MVLSSWCTRPAARTETQGSCELRSDLHGPADRVASGVSVTSAKHQRGGSRCIRNQLVNSQALGERVVQLLAAEIRHGGVLMPWKSVKLHVRVFFFFFPSESCLTGKPPGSSVQSELPSYLNGLSSNSVTVAVCHRHRHHFTYLEFKQ